jgi:uncharacterized repeat protein (TIGR01451 family)
MKTQFMSEKLALLSAFLFFLISVLIFAFLLFLILPRAKIEIKIEAPNEIKAGEIVTFKIKVKNKGTISAKNPELTFQFPDTAFVENSLIQVQNLGDVLKPKEEKEVEFQGRIFGQVGEKKDLKAWIKYESRRHTITKFAVASTKISQVPIELFLEIPEKIPINKNENTNFSFRVRIFSHLDQSISNLKLVLSLPENFQIEDSIPPQVEKSVFELPTLIPNGETQVEIFGFFKRGQEIGQELSFGGKLLVKATSKEVTLKEEKVKSVSFEPILLVSQKINGKEKYFPLPGERLHFEIFFENVGEKIQRDLTLTTILEGELFNIYSIEAPAGKINRDEKSITWDANNVPQLRYLPPGDTGKVEFWINLRNNYKPQKKEELNALIKNRVIISGFVTEFRTRVNSLVLLQQEGYFRDPEGFFTNSGPHPPAVNEITTYTIIWTVQNYYNRLENVEIKATLPSWSRLQSFKPLPGEFQFTSQMSTVSAFPEIPSDFSFEKPLMEGASGIEVKYLQIILKSEVPSVYTPQTPISGFFGKKTKEAVKAFQEKYKKEILEPQKLERGTGIVDELTIKKLNEILKKGVPQSGGEIVWKLQTIEPGVGVFDPPIKAIFQISILPQLSQKGKVISLIKQVRLVAKDQWTGQMIQVEAPEILSDIDRGGAVRD